MRKTNSRKYYIASIYIFDDLNLIFISRDKIVERIMRKKEKYYYLTYVYFLQLLNVA